MYGISYFDLHVIKALVEGWLSPFEQLHHADMMDRNRGVWHSLASRVGAILIRLGTWLEQPTRTANQVSN